MTTKISKRAWKDFIVIDDPVNLGYQRQIKRFVDWLNEKVECPHDKWEEDFESNSSSRSVPTRCVYCKARYNSDKITRYRLYEVES